MLPSVAQVISTFTVVAGSVFAVHQTLNIRRQWCDEIALTLTRGVSSTLGVEAPARYGRVPRLSPVIAHTMR